jgi:hypothetical protein
MGYYEYKTTSEVPFPSWLIEKPKSRVVKIRISCYQQSPRTFVKKMGN